MKKKWRLSTLTMLAASAALAWSIAGPSPAGSPQKASAAASNTGSQELLQDLASGHADADPLHFTDIDFLSDTTGRAAGNGFLIGTSDGGSHWQKIYKGSWLFDQIVFPDNVKGWALAKASEAGPDYLLKTTDGGTTWTRVNPQSMGFKHIDVVGGTVFGYTFNGVYKSTNGGTTWQKIKVPANTRGAVFDNASGSSGYALTVIPGGGYTVMKTKNGGAVWSTVLKVTSLSSSGGALYSNGKQVWALLNGEVGMSQISYSLYASRNGGSAWNRVIAQDTAGGGPAPGSGKAAASEGPASPGGHPGNMQLIGAGTAYLAGASPAGEVAGVGRSFDGGKSWLNAPASIKGYDARISFPSAKTGWLAVTSLDYSAVYLTHDGGLTWNQKLRLPNTAS